MLLTDTVWCALMSYRRAVRSSITGGLMPDVVMRRRWSRLGVPCVARFDEAFECADGVHVFLFVFRLGCIRKAYRLFFFISLSHSLSPSPSEWVPSQGRKPSRGLMLILAWSRPPRNDSTSLPASGNVRGLKHSLYVRLSSDSLFLTLLFSSKEKNSGSQWSGRKLCSGGRQSSRKSDFSSVRLGRRIKMTAHVFARSG